MAQQLIDRRDQEFVIWEQMALEETLADKRFKEFNRKACDLVIKEARAIAVKEMLPTLAEGDRQGVRFENGAVKVPDCFHRVFDLIVEGEWNNLGVPQEMGGQGAPPFVAAAAGEYFMAANYALIAYAAMGNGTANMIQLFGTAEQKEIYVRNLTSSKWGGTMLLTEPEAGSDVGALTTTAVRNSDGTYIADRQQDLHHQRRARPGRKHHPPGAGPHRGRPAGHQGDFVIHRPQIPRQRRREPGRTQRHHLHRG